MADTKNSILVIDDDTLLLNALSSAFKDAGYEVFVATDGEQGIKLALEHKPGLTLLDFQMPGMNGLETLKKLREDEWGKSARIIFATNTYDIDLINEVMAKGVGEYILKSDTSLEQIVELVNRHF